MIDSKQDFARVVAFGAKSNTLCIVIKDRDSPSSAVVVVAAAMVLIQVTIMA